MFTDTPQCTQILGDIYEIRTDTDTDTDTGRVRVAATNADADVDAGRGSEHSGAEEIVGRRLQMNAKR